MKTALTEKIIEAAATRGNVSAMTLAIRHNDEVAFATLLPLLTSAERGELVRNFEISNLLSVDTESRKAYIARVRDYTTPSTTPATATVTATVTTTPAATPTVAISNDLLQDVKGDILDTTKSRGMWSNRYHVVHSVISEMRNGNGLAAEIARSVYGGDYKHNKISEKQAYVLARTMIELRLVSWYSLSEDGMNHA